VLTRFGKGKDKIRLITHNLPKGRRSDLVVPYFKIAISYFGGLLALTPKFGKQYVYLKKVIVPKAADELLRNLL
jgi:hypothetical protein